MRQKMKKIWHLAEEYSLPLILGIISALVWANVNYISYQNFLHYKLGGLFDVHFAVNDIFLVLFFGLISIEIVHDLAPNGAMHPLHKALANIMAAVGGIVFPIIVFFILNVLMGQAAFSNGWAIGTATDIAVALLFAKFIFPKKHAAFSFLLFLAIIDDFAGLGIIAIFYPNPDKPVQFEFLLLVVTAMLLSAAIQKLKVKSYWWFLFPTLISWVGMLKTGLHPALALVWIVPFMRSVDVAKAPIDKLEHDLKPIVDFGLFFFGLTNAGVPFSSVSVLTLIIFLSLFIGKTLGIFSFVKLSVLLGWKMPKKISNVELILIGMVAGVGLTVSLFVADIAYEEESIKAAAKMGALLSMVSGGLAVLLGRIILQKKKHGS